LQSGFRRRPTANASAFDNLTVLAFRVEGGKVGFSPGRGPAIICGGIVM
jgi:hypothetical protein